jgi:hypothetical protein
METLAPIGGERSVGVNTFCDCLVGMLADLLVAIEPRSDQELDRLTELFHHKLQEAMSLRDGPVGHA